MSIPVICEHCNATFKVKDRFAGKKGKCPKCRQTIVIPKDDDDDEVVLLTVAPGKTDGKSKPKKKLPRLEMDDERVAAEPQQKKPLPKLQLDQNPPASQPATDDLQIVDDDELPVIKPVSVTTAAHSVDAAPAQRLASDPVPAIPVQPAPIPAPAVPAPAVPAPAVPAPAVPAQPVPAQLVVPAQAVSAAPVPATPTAAPAKTADKEPLPVLSRTSATAETQEMPAYSQQLSDDLVGSFTSEIPPIEVSAGYSLAIFLVSIFMVLLPLAYVGIIVGICYLMIQLGPIATIIGSILILFLIKPIFAWPRRQPGIRSVTPEQEPLLYSFIDRLCQVVGAPMPKQIEIDCDVNASAGFRRGYLSMLMSDDLKLRIGLPFVAGLTLRQFTGVMAHEFGHFSQGAGMRLKWLIMEISVWFERVVYQRDRLDVFVERASQLLPIKLAIFIYLFRLMVWSGRGVLWVLMKLGYLVSGMLMQQMEFDADRYEARVAGSKVFESTCRRLHVLGIAHRMAFDDIEDWQMEGRLCDNLPRLITANIKHLPKEAMTAIDKMIAEGKTGLFDSHPADQERIANAHGENAPGVFKSALPATVLFRNFDHIAKGVTWDFYKEMLGDVKPADLHPIEQLLAMQEKQIEANKATARYFHGIFWSSRPLRLPVLFLDAPQDPDANIANITQARDQLAAAKGNTKQLLEKYSEFYNQLIQAHLMYIAHENAIRYHHESFEFQCRNLKEAQDALNHAQYSMNTLLPQIDAYENLAGQRFIWALQLLYSDRLNELEDVASLRQRCTVLMGVLSAMLGHHYMVEKIDIDLNIVGFLMAHLEDDSYAGFQKLEELMEVIYSSSMQMLDPLKNVEYPFDHALGRMSVSRFVIEKYPDKDDYSAIHQTGLSITEKLKIIYVRTVAELCQIAERVESEVGLPVVLDEEMAEEEMLE